MTANLFADSLTVRRREGDKENRVRLTDVGGAVPDIGRDHNGITFAQLSFLISSDGVPNPPVNHHQRLRAIRVIMTAVRMAWFEDAAANGHLMAVA